MPATHYIKKEQIELAFPSEAAAEEQWDSLMEFHKQEGHQVMSDVFDQMVSDNRWIRIDSLHIDLGKISRQNFRQAYLDSLRSSLQKSLSEMIQEKKHTALANELTVWEDIIIHYLQYGTVLWETVMQSSSVTTNKELHLRDVLEEKILDRMAASDSFRKLVGFTLRQHPTAMQRWIRQFSTTFHERVE